MIVPYSTDAPIYHFPWMTIVLIVVNCITFGITRMGLENDGWLLQYGNGLHPLEWVAYNFLHFGPFHLLGNMFFLWAFGIVVEGKLGWWKFLAVYLGVGILGGLLIQVAMLAYRPNLDMFGSIDHPPRWSSWLEPSNAYAQDEDVMADNEEKNPGDDRDFDQTPEEKAQLEQAIMDSRPGAGGASLIVFALLGIVLVWAPKNEVSCFFMIGFRAGTFEVEYIYFCGFKIAMELLGSIWGIHGYEVTSEVAHALGAVLGFGVGTLFLKLNWVDCENWDLFAYAQNKHGNMAQVGTWQDNVVYRTDRMIQVPDDLEVREIRPKARKKRAKAKLQEMESFDADYIEDDLVFVDEEEEVFELGPEAIVEEKPSKTRQSTSPTAARPANPPKPALNEIRVAIKEGRLDEALKAVRRQRATDPSFELPKAELSCLANGFFKAHNVRDGRAFLEEFIRRFPDDADRYRVKLAVLYVKFLKSPKAALKLLAAVDKDSLPNDYQPIHQQAARQAQQMISDGMVDSI